MRIGAQLYTVREACQTPEGLADALARVAEIGYRTVQVSGTCPYDAQWLNAQLDHNGLECVLTHIPVPRLTGDLPGVIRDHRILGCENIGLGYWGFSGAGGMTLDKWLEIFPPVARAIREAGGYFMYHNHNGEFRREGGRRILEILTDAVPASEMGITLDTYWVQVAGADPAQWLNALAGRVPVIHLKDCGFDGSMQALGEGNLNFDRVFEAAESAGTRFMLVEQDDCHGEDPFDCLRRSYRYLRAHGFE